MPEVPGPCRPASYIQVLGSAQVYYEADSTSRRSRATSRRSQAERPAGFGKSLKRFPIFYRPLLALPDLEGHAPRSGFASPSAGTHLTIMHELLRAS
jgi:hypothetical protein